MMTMMPEGFLINLNMMLNTTS